MYTKNKNNNMKKALAVLMFLFLLPTLAQAQETKNFCSDDSTLTHLKTVGIGVNETGLTRTLNVVEEEHCPWGCQDDACSLPPYLMWGIIIGVIIIFAVIWFVFFKQGR
jgi:hypothetical protein